MASLNPQSEDLIYEAQVDSGPPHRRPVGSYASPRGCDVADSWFMERRTKRKLLARLFAPARKGKPLVRIRERVDLETGEVLEEIRHVHAPGRARPVERGARALLSARAGARLGDRRQTREGVARFTMRLCGDCERPVAFEQVGRSAFGAAGDGKLWAYARGSDPGVLVYTGLYRCRECPSCVRQRQMEWFARGLREAEGCFAAGNRVWMCTLTVRPAVRQERLASAIAATEEAGDPWAELSEAERFKRHVAEYNPDIDKFVRDLRRVQPAAFRYIVVPEAHKDGNVHFHALLFEYCSAVVPVLKRNVEACWSLGFVHARLLKDQQAVGYVTKYVAKHKGPRIRASKDFGNYPWSVMHTLYSIAIEEGVLPPQTALQNCLAVIETVLREERKSRNRRVETPSPDPSSSDDGNDRSGASRNRSEAETIYSLSGQSPLEPQCSAEDACDVDPDGEWIDPGVPDRDDYYFARCSSVFPVGLAMKYSRLLACARDHEVTRRLAAAAAASRRLAGQAV